MSTATLQEDPLVAALLNKGLIDEAGVEAIIDHQRGPDDGLGGILFTVDPVSMSLVVGDPLGRGSEEIMLGDRTEPWNAHDFPAHAPPYLALFTDEGGKAGEMPAGAQAGLLLMDDACYIVGDAFRHEEHLPLGSQVLFNGASHRGLGSYPYDLALSPDFRFLLVGDRGAGTLSILDSETFAILQRHQVRSPGSNKAINCCWVGDRIYATDNQTSALVTIDPFGTGDLTRQALAVGVLGNLVPHPDGRRVFLMTLKPHFALFVLDPTNPMPEKAIPIKGDPYSPGNDPTDLMALSPDGDHLLVMTFVNEPTPYSPVINVVEVATQKNVQRYRLSRKPVSLGFSRPNPYFYPRIDTVTAILDLGLVDGETLAFVQRELNGETASFDVPVGGAAGNDDMLDQVAAIRQAAEQAKEAEAAALAAGARQVERTDKVDIPAIAEELIVAHCIQHFLTETKEIDLTDDAMAVDRLKTAAHTCREELEWYTASRIRLSFLHGDLALDLWIERDEVLEWLRQRERDGMLKDAKITTIPSHCPNCGKHLLGSYICRMCGFELDVPEAMKQKRRLSLASAHPAANLAEGHLLLVDADRHRVVEIDHQRQIVWQIAKDVLHQDDMIQLQRPADVVRLANGNTLVVDREANRVAEVTPRGRAFWEVPQSDDFPELRLYKPVRATRLEGGGTLIVDRGHHRLLEIDRQFGLTWHYGEREVPGIEDGHLWHPTDVQRLANGNSVITDSGNNRVIELSDGKIIWQYGNAENLAHGGEGAEPGQLNRPTSAWRLDDGNTLITDTGNGRVLIVDAAGEIVWQYQTGGGDDDVRIDEPLRSFRVKSDVVLVTGRERAIEINERGVVTWACAYASLAMAAVSEDKEQRVGKFKLARGNPYMKQLEERRAALADKAAATGGPAGAEGLSAAAQDRMAGLAKIAASRLGQSEEATSNLTPLALILVYRARNLVYRVSRQKRVLWRFGQAQLERPHAAQILTNSRVLVVDTNHHRVIEVDTTTDEIVWHYGENGKSGHEPGQLANPRWAQRLPDGNTVIADQSNNRVIEVDPDGLLVWQWGSWETLNGPYCCQRLDDGHTLLTDWSHHTVMEVSADGDVVWQYGETKHGGDGPGLLHYPEMATRLANGNTLIADTRNNRVLEVHPEGSVVWAYVGEGLHKLNGPTFAQRQSDGHTVIVHGGNRQAIEVDSQGQVVWKYLLPVERE